MANAIPFDGANIIFTAPPDMPGCEDLAAYYGWTDLGEGTLIPVIVSCWELTPEELKDIREGGKIFLWVFSQSISPVAVGTAPPVLITEPEPIKARPGNEDGHYTDYPA